jgi:hypothetical protein
MQSLHYFPAFEKETSETIVVQPRQLPTPPADSFRRFVNGNALFDQRVEKRFGSDLRVEKHFGSELGHILQIRAENEFAKFQNQQASLAIHVPVLPFIFRLKSTIAISVNPSFRAFRFPSPSFRTLVCVKIETKSCTAFYESSRNYRLFAGAVEDLFALDFSKFELMYVGCAVKKNCVVNALGKLVQQKSAKIGRHIDIDEIQKFRSKEPWVSQFYIDTTDELRPKFDPTRWK